MDNFRPASQPLVLVTWDDAHVTLEEMTEKQAQKNKPIRTYTCGFLLAENEHGVTIVSDVYEKHRKHGKIANFIGWEMIVSYEYLTE